MWYFHNLALKISHYNPLAQMLSHTPMVLQEGANQKPIYFSYPVGQSVFMSMESTNEAIYILYHSY